MPQYAVTVEYTIVYTGCITLKAKTQDIARERIAARTCRGGEQRPVSGIAGW